MEAVIKRTDATNQQRDECRVVFSKRRRLAKDAGEVLKRIAELQTLSTDVTKSATDGANDDEEFHRIESRADQPG